MIIHERSVTKPYWAALEQYIIRRLITNRFEPVKNTGVLLVYGGSCTITYVIVEDGKPIAWLYLARRPKWKAWEVRQVWVFPEHRGRGLAVKIYRAAVNGHGIILASGKTQSKSSRALWHSFVERNMFRIWAQDFNNLNLKSQVWVDDHELQCNLEIYTRDTTSQDVRLIAIRK